MTSELGALTNKDDNEIKKMSVQLNSLTLKAETLTKTNSIDVEDEKLTEESVNISECPTSSVEQSKESKQIHAIGPNDFYFLQELGEGSFSTVHLVSEKKTGQRYAAKVCHKVKILKEKKVAEVHREKEILRLLSTKENAHPFIVQLLCTFQDSESLYFVLTLATRKDLLHLLRKRKKQPLSLDQCRFIAAELLSAMGHIHLFKIVHRDLKPENILIKDDGHIMVSDFGCAKQLDEKKKDVNATEGIQEFNIKRRKCSFVGTAQYVSPEVLQGDEVQQACDYWSFGVIIYEILSYRRPFADVSEYFMYKKILRLDYSFDNDFPDSTEAKDLISRLLVLNPSQRFGAAEQGGYITVKNHQFFKNLDWGELSKIDSPIL